MATSNISTISETKEWVEACGVLEECEIESLHGDIAFRESALIPAETSDFNAMYLKEFEPRDYRGNGVNKFWVLIDKKSKLRKRPPSNLVNIAGVNTYNGSINVHDADIHRKIVNEYFHNHTGVTDTLAVAVTAGEYTITVTNGTLFTIGNYIQISNGLIEATFPQIKNIVGNILTLDRPLDNGFAIGNNVEEVLVDMNVLGTQLVPVSFKMIPNQNEKWHIVRFLLSITHPTAGDLGLFGDLPKLTYPVLLRQYDGELNTYVTFTAWNANSDIKDDVYDVDFNVRSGGGGTYGTTARGSLRTGTGAIARLDGSKGDYLEMLIQSDLTLLTSFRFKAQGHLE